MARTKTHRLLLFGLVTVPLLSTVQVADDRLLEVPQLRSNLLPASQQKHFEKGGLIGWFCTVTVSPKLTHKLTKRAVFKSELICDILLRSSINKDRSERFVLTVISLSRMRKKIETSRIFHDQASKKSVSRLIQISKVKSYHQPRSEVVQNSHFLGKTHMAEDFTASCKS